MDVTPIPKLFSFPISLAISVLFTVSVIDLAKKKNIFDGKNHLKHHLEKVCPLGGISIFSSFWITAFIASGMIGKQTFAFLFVGTFLLFLTGVKDDLVGIPALKRLGIQLFVASFLFIGGLRLAYIPGFEASLPIVLSYLLTIVLIGATANAYNFIDGVNGLIGSLSVISSLGFSMLFYFSGLESHAALALTMAGAVLGFLWFNFGKAKIFMGDNGSTFIGVMLAYFAIVCFQNESVLVCQPIVAISLLILPLADAIRVVLGRISSGRSPFQGDRTHIHHLMLNAGFGPIATCLWLGGWSLLVAVGSFNFMPDSFFLGVFLLLLVGNVPYLVLVILSKSSKAKQTLGVSNAETGEAL